MVIMIAFMVLLLTTACSMYFAIKGRKMDMREWAVGGRSFGTLLFWFLSAGEIFTTFAFLGASGWAYQYGAPGFYILANVALGYVLGYWLLPRIWSIGKKHDIYTQADFFRLRFESRWLASAIAIIGILAMIPYTQLQFTGLSLIIQIIFHGAIDKTWAVIVSGLLVLIFVFTAGIRGTAFASIVKDLLMLAVLIGVTMTIASATHLGSISHIFELMNQKYSTYASLPGLAPKKGQTVLWFMSTILMVNVGYWMWPHQFQMTCSAKSADAIRKNAVFQPLYALSYFFVFVIGFAALLVLPKLKDSNAALLTLISNYYPGWFLGLLGAAGMLIAIIPSSALLLTLGTIFSQSIYRNVIHPNASDKKALMVGRLALIAGVILSVWLTIHSNKTIVQILLIAYSAVSQIGPGFILALLWKRITAYGVLAGSVAGLVGITVPSVIHFEKSIAFTMNTGFIALLFNIAITVLVSLATKSPSDAAIRVGVNEEEENIAFNYPEEQKIGV
ncbi:sodium:solute symporter family protein [Fodinisporobacter ferrooxydans]|uniref:Sodium:solute symporter family protein n=1 Tax=Fodinisporobacter ferrooxydans TaxID=2901836 RepID=A0ABY4CF09_9BACL|nr:sodium:solute symporter family protein [Alicyclobacillaceae bacterium MYW30-H2]